MHILIVSTDESLVEDIKYSFDKDGDRVSTSDHIDQALMMVKKMEVDFCLLGDHFPDGDALDFMRGLGKDSDLPVIAFGKDPAVKDVVLCLEYGCVDFMRYPINLVELKARMRVSFRLRGQALQKSDQDAENLIQVIGGLKIDPVRHVIFTDQGQLDLSRKEFELLYCLIQNEGQPMSREKLRELVWGNSDSTHERTVDVYIRRIREKLAQVNMTDCVQTQWGEGYVFSSKAHLD